jgi:homoserine kinase type II
MATYTSLTDTDVARILAHYDLGRLASIQPLKGGQANSSFRLETSRQTAVLSICDEKTVSDVLTLARVLDLLEANDFPTTRVVKTTDGRPVVAWNGKPVLVKTYIHGKVPTRIDSGRIFQVGRRLAHLHGIPAPPGIPHTFAYGPEAFTGFIEAYPDTPYSTWLAAKADYLKRSIGGDLPRRMIHGDLFYDNTLFEDDRLVAVIDFEEVCVYFRVFDIGMSVVGFCALDSVASLEVVNAMVAGYQSVTALTAAERRQLQAMTVLGATATSFWRYRQYNILYPDGRLAASHRPMDRLADGFQACPTEEFIRASR